MAWDLGNFSGGYAPDWIRSLDPDQMGQALYLMGVGKLGAGKPTNTEEWLASRIKNELYNPWTRTRTAAGKPTASAETWAREYWDWMRQGAKTRTTEAAHEVDKGPVGTGALHYVSGVGYVTEDRLAEVDPTMYRTIQDKRKAAEEDTGDPDAYYENYKQMIAAKNRIDPHLNWAGKLYGQKSYADWLKEHQPTYDSSLLDPVDKTLRDVPPKNVIINFGANGTGAGSNRNGNFAATATPGEVTRTPTDTLYPLSQRIAERTAKRVGRSVSQSGMSRTPSALEMASLANRWRWRRF